MFLSSSGGFWESGFLTPSCCMPFSEVLTGGRSTCTSRPAPWERRRTLCQRACDISSVRERVDHELSARVKIQGLGGAGARVRVAMTRLGLGRLGWLGPARAGKGKGQGFARRYRLKPCTHVPRVCSKSKPPTPKPDMSREVLQSQESKSIVPRAQFIVRDCLFCSPRMGASLNSKFSRASQNILLVGVKIAKTNKAFQWF